MKTLRLTALLSTALVSVLILGMGRFAAAVPIGDFDTELAPWTLTDGDGAQHNIGVSDTAHAGEGSLHLEKTNGAGFVQLQSAEIPVEASTSYRTSAWFNTLPADEKAGGQTPGMANVFVMISQLKVGSKEMDAPNLFSPLRHLFSSDGKWEKLEMSFATRAGVDRVRVSLVITDDVVDLLWDDVQLERIDEKPRFEAPTPETLLPLDAAQKILEARPRATAEVRQVGQRPRLFIDGKPDFPGFYVGSAWQGKVSQIGDFKKAGVNVYLIPYTLGRGVYGNFGAWSGPNQADFSEVDELMWRVLRADPNGYIMFYLATDPYPGWAAENLDDVVTDQFGNKAIVDMHFKRWDKEPPKVIPGQAYVERYGQSYVSSRLRHDTGEILRRFDQHIKASLPGKAVIGYHVIGGQDTQMFQWDDFAPGNYADYSPASLQAFREWLQTKYQTNEALQKNWNLPDVTFQTAAIPTAERRDTDRLLLDQPADHDIVDFNRFRSEGIVDTLNGYAQVLRDSHGTPILLGTYYAGPGARVLSHQATGYLLKKGLFNYVTSVLTYNEIRWPGGPGKAHQAWSSLLLHNTFGLSEEDFRSWKTIPENRETDYFVGRVETAEESNAMIRRDTGHMLAAGQGAWWYDMYGGWFNDPSIMRGVEESVRGFKADLKDDALPRADVAVFIDEDSLNHLAGKQAPTLEYDAIDQQIVMLNSSGVPYHLYLQSDVADPKLPQYKLYLFLNAYHVSPPEWSAIQKLRQGNKTLAFLHAPGTVSGSIPGANDAAEAVTKLTGITVQAQGEQQLQLTTIPGNDFYDGSINRVFVLAPTFTVTDALAKPIANYANGKTAVAYKDFGNWKGLFFGGVGLNEFFINALARHAGAWVAAPAGNAVYASQYFLTIHAMYPGEKKVQLLQKAKVIDLVDGKEISPNTQVLTFPMQRGETRWFRLEKP